MKRLLITGATGLVGRYLLRDLLAKQLPVAVLCRSNRMESAAQRIESLIVRWESLAGRKLPRPVVLDGNLYRPNLGLDPEQLAWIAGHCDAVLHNAASMTFREDKHGEPFRTNVNGMKNVLAVCEQAGIRQFHHVSTAYVCGLREGTIYEHELDLGQQNGNVYEVSKMTAEKLVRAAGFLDQLTVYRPASVVGDSQTGYTTSSHGFYLPLQMAYVMADKVPPELMGERFFRLLGLTGDEGKNLVAVDWLSQAIVELVTHPEHHGQTYHLTNPQTVTVRLIQRVIREAIEEHTTKRFVGTPTEDELVAYKQMFLQYMEIYRSHWRDDPTFDRTNTDRALAHLPCIELNHQRMLAVASYPVKHKFVLGHGGHEADAEESNQSPPASDSQPRPAATATLFAKNPTDIPIAVVGMACKLPGANNLDEYWQLVVDGRSAISEVPPERLDQSLYYDPRKGQRGKTYSKLGGMLKSRKFDRKACPISPELEESVDNAHLLMCQVAAEACRHAGFDPFNLPLRNTGVYIGHAQGSDLSGRMVYGTCIEEAAQFLRESPGFQALPSDQQEDAVQELIDSVRSQMPQRGPDSADLAIHMVAGTISKAFGLNGPFMAINSACASSLQTIQLAARALQLGRVDMAIVGGASDLKDGSLVLFANAQSMSESGSRPFDENADGLIVAEGYVALVLKTLPRALADGDPIQAIVMGIGASSDGRGKSLWAPRKEGQVAAMERAYRSGLDMGSLQYVEAHATSTSLGDATELNSLSDVLSGSIPAGTKIPVTSVKANIGHTLEAAGIAGLIKTVLCMQNRTFAPAANIQSLNSKINWEQAPIYVPLKSAPWPKQPNGLPRRAAVNAFGIGGLNVHLVLEEFTEDRRDELRTEYATPGNPPEENRDENAIAVIGMGCILPGAPNAERYWQLIASGQDPKTQAPTGRWRTDLACEAGTRRPYRAANSLGGYITDFAYDWQRHKVPPKQVQQADPLQFMLLDAAEQALNDAGYDKKEFDRTRTAVLVGTEFNGDFGTQLAISLRLPELERTLREQLGRKQVPADRAAAIAAEFSEALLKHWPALIDESGSFSTSTLASRITKTMNLMGGAASIDAGDASAAAALAAGIDLLLAGDCDLLLCAGGQRSMNLPQYEAMTQCGILASGDKPASPFDANADGIVPGEGVGMVLLKRLGDARRDGDRIRAIIRGVGAAHASTVEESLALAMTRAFSIAKVAPAHVALVEVDGTGQPAVDEQQLRAIASVYGAAPRTEPLLVSTVTGQIGHTCGASAMASLIKASLEIQHGEVPRNVGLSAPLTTTAKLAATVRLATTALPLRQITDDGRRFGAVSSFGKGLSYHILLEHGERVPASKTIPTQSTAAVTVSSATAMVDSATLSGWNIYRFGAATDDELAQKVKQTMADPSTYSSFADRDSFLPTDRARLAIVARGPEMLAEKLQAFAKQGQNAAALPVLEQQGCFYRQVAARRPRVAFLFPGQGSQYPGMLRELVCDVPAAAATMSALDALLIERGFPTFADLAWERSEQLGSDIWRTQLAMLLANLISHAAIVEMGIQPDLVSSHSYGEFAAVTAAGAWDLASVLTAARARVDGIEATPTARGTMLATPAPPQLIEQLAAALPERAYLANYNAPDQTVVGGREDSLRQLSKLLDVMGHKSQMIPVPCPFHTPWMEGSGRLLEQALAALPIEPPRVPLLSSVTNRYVAEPEEIRANLTAQLITPVRYCDLINRIATDRDTVFVEVGPQQALTRLNRRILEGREVPGIIATDHPKRPGSEQLLHVRALLECVGAFPGHTAGARSEWGWCANVSVTASAPGKHRKGSVVHVDGTERRRSRMRDSARQGSYPVPSSEVLAPVVPVSHRNGSIESSQSATIVASAAGQLQPEPPQSTVSKQPTRNPAELERFLINFVVEQTGYPPEVVELDADLEADLGIDSIKKAQLFGELAEYFDVKPDEDMTLDDFPTLRHVTEFLQGAEFKKELAGEPVSAKAKPIASTAPAERAPAPTAIRTVTTESAIPVEALAATSVSTAAPQAIGQSPAELEQFLVNFVVEQTGYPPEVVELDADLEADLGIDSIKKAQLFGELAEYFDVKPDENMTLDDFPTLRHVVNFLAKGDVKKKELTSPDDASLHNDAVANAASDFPVAPYDLDEGFLDVSHRYALRTLPSPLDSSTPEMPRWCGAALIVGSNPSATALFERLSRAGVTVRMLNVSDNLNATLAEFEQLWNEQPLYHLFLMTGRDGGALDPIDDADWRRRRYRTAILPYFLCQRWAQLAAEAKLLNRSTLVAATSLGGDLGFSGTVKAPESGALTGLMKAIFIEFNVLRNFETFLVKAIDSPHDEPPDLLAASICRELASRTVDYEVAYVRGERYLQNAWLQPAAVQTHADIRPGGTWVLTGGARGITALCGLELGRRFGLKLHLLGSSPSPQIEPEWRNLSEAGLKSLQASVMREARAKGQSMEEAWSRVRKDLEIDRSLMAFSAARVDATYHACDVADENALRRELDIIRQASGPIEGIIHGAGIERSCNYERKKPEIVEATLSAKVDGAINLMRLTRQDPVRYFVGFGSVSGRLGSNGQTDYCMASDLLCKLTGWYRTWRPEVRAVGIHWHPWAEVGMAATPETSKLLKLSGGPTSMNKEEGVRHLIRELYAGAPDAEVMITDDEYHGRYYEVPHPPRPLPDDATVIPNEIASRHQLRMVAAPLPATNSAASTLVGAACILGSNPTALALHDRLLSDGISVHMLPDSTSLQEVTAGIESIYNRTRFQHLFLMTGRDELADSLLDTNTWQARRAAGFVVPFLATQHWFRLRRKAKDTSPITVSAATALGGDFGVSGNVALPDGGAISGLLKSLYVEDTRRPQRELRVKVVDAPQDEPPASIAEHLVQELAGDDPNIEVGWSNGQRSILRSFIEPADSLAKRRVKHGGIWVVTGGARGITAAASLELGKRFGLKLHLIGRSPAPQPDAPWRNYSDEQLSEFKSQVVRQSIAAGRSPERDWDRVKHDREIDESLRKFAAAGVKVNYHSCDVAERDALAAVLDTIRQTDGPIDGIVHGAGWGRPGRFDSRSQDTLQSTIAGKLDGAINLMALTQSDPVRHWIGFGSISGRCGGNGLSDYAAANEMLAKLVDWYCGQRPDCKSCCIHWQSWDEVGMAMLADNSTVGTKGVLKMDFISPREGCGHLCRELEAGLPTSEVLITDGFFERIFYPFVNDVPHEIASSRFPLVETVSSVEGTPGVVAEVVLDPQADPFLRDHTLRGKPLLPAVIGLEALAEAACIAEGKQVTSLRQVEFREGLSFGSRQAMAARVRAVPHADGVMACQLLSDFKNRAGVVLQRDRIHFAGLVDLADRRAALNISMPPAPQSWHPFEFRSDGPMVHGPVFQGVKGVSFDGETGWGELIALSLGDLGGPGRGRNWLVPATLLDAAFYVCGIHLWLNVEPVPALPQSIEVVRLGRMPRDGERALVHVRCRETQPRQATYDFTIYGEDRSVIVQVEGYQCVMLKSKAEMTSHA